MKSRLWQRSESDHNWMFREAFWNYGKRRILVGIDVWRSCKWIMNSMIYCPKHSSMFDRCKDTNLTLIEIKIPKKNIALCSLFSIDFHLTSSGKISMKIPNGVFLRTICEGFCFIFLFYFIFCSFSHQYLQRFSCFTFLDFPFNFLFFFLLFASIFHFLLNK